MKIKYKLLIGFLGIALSVQIVSIVAYRKNRVIHYEVMQMYQSSVNEVEYTSEMLIALQSSQTGCQELIEEKFRGIHRPLKKKTRNLRFRKQRNISEKI